MAGRTPRAAVGAFVKPIKEAIACFASCKVTADSYDPDVEGVLAFNEGTPVLLRKRPGAARLALEGSMRYRIVEDADQARGPWKVSTSGWMYELSRDGRPVLAFHWHPARHAVEYPHLHAVASASYRKLHVPTGRVLLEDVLTLAEELGAQALVHEWSVVMERNRKRFARGATWGIMQG